MAFELNGTRLESKKFNSENCSQSVCYIENEDIILVGLAEDIINVSVYYQSENALTNTYYNATQTFLLQLRACLPGES